MSKVRRVVLIILSYFIAFIAAVVVTGFMMNGDTISGNIQNTGSTLPVLYVRVGGQLINEMHGYIEPVDAGYYRDTLTPMADSKTINLSVQEYGHSIESAEFELYNDRYDTLVESGECIAAEKIGGMQQMQLNIRNSLNSNREYCLRIMLTNDDGQVINYYTRIRYGSDLKVAEKMKFIMDFNEATFDKNNAEKLASYLESTSDSSNYSKVTLNSSSDVVTWGNMAPYRTSELSIRLKEINTETAAFTLSYMIESSANERTTFYTVVEYYRIRWTSSKIYLLDYQREMTENIGFSDINIENGAIRLGVGDLDRVDIASYGAEEQKYSYITVNNQLWLYDSINRIMTKVYVPAEDGHNCGQQSETGIRVIHGDPVTGDLYFIIYGYMHGGNYEGQEGIMVCYFNHESVRVEEEMFIPYNKGFQQLSTGLEQLSYMNDEGHLYIRLENVIYRIDLALGRMEVAWDGLSSNNCAASADGIVVIGEGGQDGGADRLRVINLNTGAEKKMEQSGWLMTPLGFAGKDFIYGLIDPKLTVQNSQGIVQYPISEVHIVDSQLNEIRAYQKAGSYIMGLAVSQGNIVIKLASQSMHSGYIDYVDAGEDYIIRNHTGEQDSIYLDTAKDNVRGIENWIYLDTSDSFVPIVQTARFIDPGYDITKNFQLSDDVELQYYVYTKGRLDAVFDTVGEAVAYGNAKAGTIMTSHKQIIWQRAGRAYIWNLDIDAIGKVRQNGSMNKILINTIADYEGWELSNPINDTEPLFGVMAEVLPADVIDLTGLEMTDMLHFIYRDRVVAAKISANMFALIVAYDDNSDRVKLADPTEGTVSWMSWSAAESLFEANGNVFYSYLD